MSDKPPAFQTERQQATQRTPCANPTTARSPSSRGQPLRQAAQALGLCSKTLLRAAREGRLGLSKHPVRGVWLTNRRSLRAAPLLSLGQAARQLGVHIETTRRWIRAGKLRAYRRTKKSWWRVSLREIARVEGGRP